MNKVFCNNCEKEVLPVRPMGLGTLLMILLTCGFWIICIPFYSLRCGTCKNLLSKENIQKAK